jgi:hypothetical protein
MLASRASGDFSLLSRFVSFISSVTYYFVLGELQRCRAIKLAEELKLNTSILYFLKHTCFIRFVVNALYYFFVYFVLGTMNILDVL